MLYNATDGSQLATWSAFLVGRSMPALAIPMVPRNVTVIGASNDSFGLTYNPTYLGVSQGTATIRAGFSAVSAPQFSMNFTRANSSNMAFNILWFIAPAFRYLNEKGTSIDLQSLGTPTLEGAQNFSASLGSSARPSEWTTTFQVSWADAQAGALYAGSLSPLGTPVGAGLVVMFPDDQASVDPTFVATTTTGGATAYPSERKTFFYDGFYWAFYDSGNGILAQTSPDGRTWSAASDPSTGAINLGFDVAQQGSTVALAWIDGGHTVFREKTGTLVKGNVNWNATVTVSSMSTIAAGPVGSAISGDGNIWVAGDWQVGTAFNRFVFRSHNTSATLFDRLLSESAASNDQYEMDKPIPEPNGQVVLLWSHAGWNTLNWKRWTAGTWGSASSLTTNIVTSGEGYADVSAVVLSDGTIWAAYPGVFGSQKEVDAATIPPPPAAAYWQTAVVTSASPVPTLGVDDFDDLYLFWLTISGTLNSIYFTVYTSPNRWGPAQLLYSTSTQNLAYLTAATRMSSSAFMLYWQAHGTSTYYVYFVSMPLLTGLGSSPSQPWLRDGLSPYGTYFKQASEYVAPGNGLLTVVQTDLQLPGRGLDLAISRVFATPRTFLNTSGSPTAYLYDAYNGATLGLGWQLNFPWIGQYYLHLWNGQTYLIRWNATGVFENHAGEQFRLYQSNCGRAPCYLLEVTDGTDYTFNAAGQLTTISDFTGYNGITFSYGADGISSITDSVGRLVNFTYDANGRLQSIVSAGRTVTYGYDPQGRLISVLDSVSRRTTFAYGSYNQWLLTGITYPSGGRTTYSYNQSSVGSEATSYLVSLQNVYTGTPLVKSTNLTYDLANGKVFYAKVTVSNGSAVQGSTTYNFGSPVNGMTTTTFDAGGKQLRRLVGWYSPNGAVSQQDIYSGNTSSKSSSTFQAIDNWGNVIYTRDAIGHESFSSYANTNTANVFYGPGTLSTSSSNRIMSSNFDNRSMSDWALHYSGPTAGWIGLSDSADPANAPSIQVQTNQTSSTVSYAGRSFPSQPCCFVAEGRIRTAASGLTVFFLLMSATGIRVYFMFDQSGQIDWYKDGVWHSIGSWQPNQWYKVAFEVDVVAGTYNIWINGKELACANSAVCPYGVASLYGSGSIVSMRLQSGFVGEVSTPIISFGDDFKVYTSGTVWLNGITAGTEVEETDVAGNIVRAGMVPSGSSSLSVNSLSIPSHEYFVQIYNTTGPMCNGNMETIPPWLVCGFNLSKTNANWGSGGFSTYAHTGGHSYVLNFSSGASAGDWAGLYDDVSGFRPNDIVRAWFSVAPNSGKGGCSSTSQPAFMTVALSSATFGGLTNLVNLATYTMNVSTSANYPSSLGWTQLVAPVAQSTFRLLVRVIAGTAFTSCSMNVYLDDIDEAPEFVSPTTDFWGGDSDGYTPPVWRTGEFNSGIVPSSLHNRAVGSLSWQNGSTDPVLYLDMQTFQTPSRPDLFRDLSGHGNAAQYVSTTDTPGIAGRARQFFGADYLAVADTPSLDPSTFSISLWINPASPFPNASYTRIVAKDNYVTPFKGWIILYDGTSPYGRIYLALFNTAGGESDSPRVQLVVNSWNFVAFTFDGARICAYLNGGTVGNCLTMSGTFQTSQNRLLIGGGDSPTPNTYFLGKLDEFRMYARPLSASEVLKLGTQVGWFDMETFSTSTTLADMSGYQVAGTVTGTTSVTGKVGKALSFNGTTDTVALSSPAVNTTSGATTTVAFWMYWTGTGNQIPFGFNLYDLFLSNAWFGFNTGNGDLYGINSTGLANTWVHVVAEFYNGDTTRSALYLNGVPQTLSQKQGSQNPTNAYATAAARLSGWAYSSSYKFGGILDEVHLYRRALASSDVAALFTPQTTPPSRTFYKYNSVGENSELRTYHNGSWLYTRRTFDAYGNVLSETDPNGVVTTYAYSSTYGSAYLTSMTRGSSTQSYAYDFGTGLLTSKTDPRQLTTTYAYDFIGRVTSEVQPAVGGSSPTTYNVYDDVHDIVTQYDPDSMPRLFHYDMETLFNGTMEDLSGHGAFGTFHGSASVTGKVGLARSFNGTGAYIQATASISASSALTVAAWVYRDSTQPDALGDVLNGNYVGQLKISNTGVVYAQYYDGTAWRILTSKSKVTASSWTYVAATFTPSGGNTIINIYLNGGLDGNSPSTLTGHPTGSYAPTIGAYSSTTERFKGTLDEIQMFSQDLTAAQVSSLYQGTQGGRYLKTYYDGIGRQTRSVQRSFFSGPSTALYRQETYVDNWQDQVVTHVNANGSVYQSVYDFLGRPTSVTNPDNSARTTSYDDVNRIVTMIDEVGHETQDVYDLAGRLVSVRQYTGPSSYISTTNTYDLSGELVAVADPLGQTTRHVYDDAGRLSQTTYPDGTNETYVYDNVGSLTAKTDRGGRTIRYAYDTLRRLTSATYPGNVVLTYTYDNDGNLKTVLNGTASVYFYYDNLNRLTTRSLFVSGDSTNYSATYGYDAVGNLLSLTYPDGQGTLTYAYDPFYRITTMTFASSTIASFTYRKDDLLGTISYGDGSLATYVFNGRGFPLENKVTAGASTFMDLVYTENATGDIVGLTDKAASGDTESYIHDKLDRIQSATGPWGTLSYTDDAAGNRLTNALAGTTTYYKYGAYNKLCASSTSSTITCASAASGTVTKYYYDANGNIINRVTSQNNTYTFDLENRLVKAVVGSSTYTFAYDGLGDRVKETGPSGSQTYTNTYVASGDAMLYLKNVVGSTTTKTVYLYAGSLLIASVSGSTTSYFHEDHLGDTRLVTQKSGNQVNVVFSTNYEPFGVQYSASGSDPNVKYTGQWSEAVGLYWNQARYYDPTLGRFVSADPELGSLSRPQTQDRYAYVANNPLRFRDPNGRFLEILIGAVIGAVVGYVGCGLATGGWTSAECGETALAGAAVGALAGLTFGASLALAGTAGLGTATAAGGFTFAGVSGLAAFTFAGAVSGAVAGAAGYFASGGIAMANGRQWSFSSRGLVNSVGWGIVFGAATGAAGYGAGKGFSQLREWWADSPGAGVQAPSNPLELLDQGYELTDPGGGVVGRTSPGSGSQLTINFEDPQGNLVQYHSGGVFDSGYYEPPHYHVYAPLSAGGYQEMLQVFIGDPLIYWTS